MADGERLKAARLAAGFERVSDFAMKIGVKEPTVYRIESGQTPSVATLRAWADACSVTMDYLAGRVDDPEATLPPEPTGATGTEG